MGSVGLEQWYLGLAELFGLARGRVVLASVSCGCWKDGQLGLWHGRGAGVWRGSRLALAELGMAKPALADLVLSRLSFGRVFGLVYDR